jgi:hypothetical protein
MKVQQYQEDVGPKNAVFCEVFMAGTKTVLPHCAKPQTHGSLCSPKRRTQLETHGENPQKTCVIVTAVKTSHKTAFFGRAWCRSMGSLTTSIPW